MNHVPLNSSYLSVLIRPTGLISLIKTISSLGRGTGTAIIFIYMKCHSLWIATIYIIAKFPIL